MIDASAPWERPSGDRAVSTAQPAPEGCSPGPGQTPPRPPPGRSCCQTGGKAQGTGMAKHTEQCCPFCPARTASGKVWPKDSLRGWCVEDPHPPKWEAGGQGPAGQGGGSGLLPGDRLRCEKSSPGLGLHLLLVTEQGAAVLLWPLNHPSPRCLVRGYGHTPEPPHELRGL